MRASLLSFLAEHRRGRTEVLAERLTSLIETQNPGYTAMAVVSRHDLLASCRDNIGRVLELLAELLAQADGERGVPATEASYDAARATGQRRAEQGLPLDDVLRSFRLGGRLIWDDLVDQAAEELRPEDLREIGTRLWQVVDETSAQVAASYHAHERTTVRLDEQRRAELWEGLLNGRARDPRYANEAAQVLDLPVSGDYLVLTGRQLDIDAFSSTASPHASAWVHRTDGAVGLISLRERDPGPLLGRLTALADTVAVGMSAAVHGLARVDQGLGQASLALRGLESTTGLAAFDQRLPEALLVSAPDVAARLVEVWIAPLLAVGGEEAPVLLETARAWVLVGGSATRTAARVHCHRNTVLNRIRRIGLLLDADLTAETLPVDFDLALRAHRLGLG